MEREEKSVDSTGWIIISKTQHIINLNDNIYSSIELFRLSRENDSDIIYET